MDRTEVLHKVRALLVTFIRGRKLIASDINTNHSLTEDLGISSLRFFELTIALERTLRIEKFPIEEWIYAESLVEGPRYTIESLVNKCMEIVSS